MQLPGNIHATLSAKRGWKVLTTARMVLFCAILVGTCDRSATSGEMASDRYLVPLPKGAKARLGMLNLQQSPGDAPSVRGAPAISPDGKLAACGIEKHVVVWDLTNGRVIRNITAFPRQVGAVVFADHDSVLAIDGAIADGGPRAKYTVKAWDVRTGKVLRSFEISESNYSVFSHDGKLLATMWGPELEVWDTQTGKSLFRDIERHAHVFFSLDDRVVITCRPQNIKDRFVRIMTFRESRTGKITRTMELKDANAIVGVSPDGQHLLAHTPIPEKPARYYNGYRLQLLDAQTGKAVHTLADRTTVAAHSCVFSPDGRLVAGESSTWDVKTGKMIGKVGIQASLDGHLAFSRDGTTLVGLTDAGRAFTCDIATGVTRDLNPTHDLPIDALAFSADGKRLASVSGSEIYLWDVEKGTAINRCRGAILRKAPGSENDRTVKIVFAPDDKHLLAQQWDQSVRLYEPAQGREVIAFRTAGYVWGFSDSGKHLHWTPTNLEPNRFHTPPPSVPDDIDYWLGAVRWVASAAAYPEIRQFRAHRFAPSKLPDKGLRAASVQIPRDDEGTPFNLSPDGSILAECLWRPRDHQEGSWKTHEFRFTDAPTGKEIMRVPIKGDRVLLWFAADSRSFLNEVRNDAAGLPEYCLALFETRTGQERLVISKRPASFAFSSHAFSRDGRWLAISQYKSIEVFDLARGTSAASIPHAEMNPRLAFSRDGTLLASGGNSRTILLWDMNALVKREFKEAPWTAADRDRLWNDLAHADAARAFAAMMRLKRSPSAAISLVRERLGWRMPKVDLGRLIQQLDSADFATRKNATDAIEQVGDGAYPALAEALTRAKSLEERRRIEAMMVRCERPFAIPARLRLLRSVEVLDALGTPAAVALLREIAVDTPRDAPLQREIARALERAHK